MNHYSNAAGEEAVYGLASSEVEQRRQQGLGNELELKTSRPYRNIIKTNVFNPVNVMLYAIAFGMLMALGLIVLDVPFPDAVNLGAHLPPTTLE